MLSRNFKVIKGQIDSEVEKERELKKGYVDR